jgi:hypothetical protein
MVDGDVGRTLVEVGYGVAASLHQRGHQVIGFGDCAFGGIDKIRLHRLPALQEAFAFEGIEVANVELLNPLLAIG